MVPTDTTAAATGEVPADLMAKIKADLASRTGADPATMVETMGAFMTWNDGSLGCPEPDMNYLQVLTDGYHVKLKVGETEYDYRANDRGFFKLCTPKP
jgi:hypothetical protein